MGSGGSLLPAVIGSRIHTEQFRKPDLTEVTGFAQQAYSFNAGTEPKNAIDLFGASVASGKKSIQLIVKEMFINLQIQMMEHGTGLGVQEIKQFH